MSKPRKLQTRSDFIERWIDQGNLRGVLDELDTLGDVLLQATKVADQESHLASGYDMTCMEPHHQQRLRPSVEAGMWKRRESRRESKNDTGGTHSGRQAARSSSSSAESEPTEWIFSTPEVCAQRIIYHTEARSANLLQFLTSSTPPPSSKRRW